MIINRSLSGLSLISFLLLWSFSAQPAFGADDYDEPAEAETYFQARMGSSLWETLIENGVNPTLWKVVFDYNRMNNPAFSKIRSARSIPKGTVIYIPFESDTRAEEASRPRQRFTRSVVSDTLHLFGDIPFLSIKAGPGQYLNDVIEQFCIPPTITDKVQQANMSRTIRSDIRDSYRRMGRQLSYRDRTFYLPLHLLAEQQLALERKISSYFSSPEYYVPRDSLLDISPEDILHTASPGESYRSLAKRYLGSSNDFPAHYPYKNSLKDHIAYVAQHIRHYNLNQPLWPGKTYFIPSYLLGGRYYIDNPRIELARRTNQALYYTNGLQVSLEYHVTRNKTYWRRREKYLPPLERLLENGSPAYPDMILWHRTGLEPEVEDLLRSKGREHFSLPYIYRMAVSNYYIDEQGHCFLIVDPEKNPRHHAGYPYDFRCFWNGQSRVSDISIGIEIESGFFGDLSSAQLATARKLQEVIRGLFIIPDDRILDHRKVSCRRGPGLLLLRGRKVDGLTPSDRQALNLISVPDPDVLLGILDANLDMLQQRQADSTDYWYGVRIDPDLESSARIIGWRLVDGIWQRPALPGGQKAYPSSSSGQ
ncbi:MAG TPA: N-acetylmuramoyl-L-alanine amidase [archaeon]|nr:N-acetylmuramoyl-L-alanine amidase [archaeon]